MGGTETGFVGYVDCEYAVLPRAISNNVNNVVSLETREGTTLIFGPGINGSGMTLG
jgi:hypothetical protein